jgi:hypothetical protein
MDKVQKPSDYDMYLCLNFSACKEMIKIYNLKLYSLMCFSA